MSFSNLSNVYQDINHGHLKIPGYIMYHVDHRSNVKTGGVWIKTMLHLKVVSTDFLQECINFEASIGNKKCRFIHLYRILVNLRMNLVTF